MPVHSFAGLPSCRTTRSRSTGGFAVDVRLEDFAIYPLLYVIVRCDTRHRGGRLQRTLALILKADLSIGRILANKAALVNEVMMMPAEHYQVVQTRFTAISPVLYMVSIDKSRVGAARKATTLVSCA